MTRNEGAQAVGPRRRAFWALLIVILIGVGLRLWGVGHGAEYGYDPDEMVIVTAAVRFGGGDLNPHRFDWPSGLMYITFLLYGGVFALGRLFGAFESLAQFRGLFFTDMSVFIISGRMMIICFAAAGMVMTYKLGARTMSHRAGLLAAGLLAVSALSVTMDRSLTPDAPSTFFILLSIWFAVRLIESGAVRDYLLCGLAAGLAVGIKYNAAPAAVVLPAAHLVRCIRNRGGVGELFRPAIWLAAAAVALGFLICTPYAVLDLAGFRQGLAYQFSHIGEAGHIGADAACGFAYHLRRSLAGYWGWPLVVIALLGCLWTAIRGGWGGRLVLLALAVQFAFFGSLSIAFPRYMAPLMPLLCLMAAAVYHAAAGRGMPRPAAWVAAALLLVAVTPTLARTVHANIIASRPNIRTLALRWILGNPEAVPPDSRIGVEWYAPPLPLNRAALERNLARAEAHGGGERFAYLLQNPPPVGFDIIGTGLHINHAASSDGSARLYCHTQGRDPPVHNPAVIHMIENRIEFFILDGMSRDRFYGRGPFRNECLVMLQREFYDFAAEHGRRVGPRLDPPGHPGPWIEILRMDYSEFHASIMARAAP